MHLKVKYDETNPKLDQIKDCDQLLFVPLLST